MDAEMTKDMNEAGTGFMLSLSGAISHFEKKGYTENLMPRFDHFECRDGTVISAKEIRVDEMERFENSSDPDDQAIIYAISVISKEIKGLYVDSYGLYHDNLSAELLAHLQNYKTLEI